MASITRMSNSLLRITGTSLGIWKYSRIIPISSIMYINVFNRALDIHYTHKRSHDSLLFLTNEERDAAISAVEGRIVEKPVSMVRDYPPME